ncbi:hypothetical protein Taro_029749 [Colocasia esculenta]|uniref:Uncharacterized protein n=1 Tax=Colocasia esculenta TaxID=4460 RepID=A0A843VEJ8_COLES|nr:hypothetical protein [Colocasia esculenta]
MSTVNAKAARALRMKHKSALDTLKLSIAIANYSATAWAPRREEGEKMAGRREAAMRLWRRAGEESGSDGGRGSWMGGVLFHHAPKSLHLPVAVRTGGDREKTQEEHA